MTCARCQGLMVERPLWEREWRQIARRFTRPVYLWSCLNCGECVDDTIRFNRAMAKPETEAQRNERIWRTIKFRVSGSVFQAEEVGC